MQEHVRPPTQMAKGITLIIIACFFNAIQAFCVKLASPQISTLALVPIRMGFNLFLLLIYFLFKYRTSRSWRQLFATKRMGTHLIRALSGVAALYFYFLGVVYLSLAKAVVIFFSFPLFVPLVNYFWQGIRLFHHIWWGLILAFMGLIITLHIGPFFSPFALLPLVGSLFSAIAIVSVRQLRYTETTSKVVTYFYSLGFIFSLIVYAVFHKESFVKLDAHLIYLLVAIGIASTAYMTLMTLSLKFAPARLITPFFYFITLFSILFDILFLSVQPTLYTYIGAVLMVLGVILITVLYPEDDYKKREKRGPKKG